MGPRYFNAGMKGGKVTLWEGGHRVPCFLRWPAGDLVAGQDISELTHVQDLLPTLIDLCDLESRWPPRFDGTSLAARLRGKQDSLPDRMFVVNYSRMPFRVTKPTRVNGATPKARRRGSPVETLASARRSRTLRPRTRISTKNPFVAEIGGVCNVPTVGWRDTSR
jgi:arylsulfatase A-like enzyme